MTNTPTPEEKKKCKCGATLKDGECPENNRFIPSEYDTALHLLKSFLTCPESRIPEWTEFEQELYENVKMNFRGEVLQTEVDAFCRNAMRNLIMRFENKLLAPYKSLIH